MSKNEGGWGAGGSPPSIKYKATVERVGKLAGEFITEGVLVFFGPSVPDELAEFAVVTGRSVFREPVASGDFLYLGTESYTVLGVGERANQNIRELGHMVVRFNGRTEVELPGEVSVEARPVPPVEPGLVVKVVKGAE